MPIAINTNRPPSPNSNGPPRPTTTSRRGGRTRSRSPAVMSSRLPPPSASPSSGGGADPPSSAAAAAAAAAAKAYSHGPGGRPHWRPEEGDPYRSHHPGHHGYGGGGSSPYDRPPYSHPPSGSWPPREGEPYGRSSRESSRYHYPPSGHYDPYARGPPPPEEDRYSDRRYDHHAPRSYDRSRAYPPHYDYGRYKGERDYSRGREDRESREERGGHSPLPPSSAPPKTSPPPRIASRSPTSGGTSLVIGGTTPIHLKTADDSSASPTSSSPGPIERPTRSAASVFRGRPGDDGTKSRISKRRSGDSARNTNDDDSPQRILLSLKTPTTSFEEAKSENNNKNRKTSPLTLSPEMQAANQQQAQRSPDQLYDNQRSTELLKTAGSIDMAPSFTLLNTSFDSLTDAPYFTLDSTLGQTASFGLMGRTESVGNEQLLQSSTSGGNVSAQLLGTSASGGMTIGYSPVNSFGGASAGISSRRSGNMMVVGGNDTRSSSPTRVLGMYQSYSGGGPLDDTHLRMSVGSFGYTRSYAEPNSPGYYGSSRSRSQDNADRGPSFYIKLRKFKGAFKGCSFLLPGLKSALLEASFDERKGRSSEEAKGYHYGTHGEVLPQDTAVAKRRVESSICAFGGNLNQDRSINTPKEKTNPNRDSIFREKDTDQKAATVTPSSTEASAAGATDATRARLKYEERLPGRYYENESRLSWEFEEEPPIEVPEHTSATPPEEDKEDRDGDDEEGNHDEDNDSNEHEEKEKSSVKKEEGNSKDGDGEGTDEQQYCKPTDSDFGSTSGPPSPTPSSKRAGSQSPQAKMRYRCKLCGQPKQNHSCPYQQSLARSIGVNVYPAVNAFTADEPGTIAAPLSEMNNFVDVQKDGASTSTDLTPGRPTPDRARAVSSTMVSPESLRSSSRSTQSPYPSHGRVSSSHRSLSRHGGTRAGGKKRMYSQMNGGSDDQGDLLFVDAMELKAEQFRIVTASKTLRSPSAFNYPALPLPYAQRKRLSDNLFSLSNEVPKLTDECAQVLREAREKDMWDLAVSELMTQVIVILHCPDRDYRFEGLRQYLLTLGIAC